MTEIRKAVKLMPRQREAIRLEAAGTAATEIARRVKVSAATLGKWRQLPEYQAHLASIQDRADADAIAQAREVRAAALVVVRAALARASGVLAGEEVSASETATIGRYALDVYRATSAQTGIAETVRRETTTEELHGAAAFAGVEEEADAAEGLIHRLRSRP